MFLVASSNRKSAFKALLVWAMLLTACAPVRPYADRSDVRQLDRGEERLWAQSAEFDREVGSGDQVYGDEKLRIYLQGVMDRLFPEFVGKMRVQVLKAPVLNAFALPNGSIYVHASLLARMESEAQAATVLAHEGAHFVCRHSLSQMRTAKLSTALANTVTLAGIPLVGPVLAVSSIAGYSRSLESEADRMAFQRLQEAGYDTREAVKCFQRMVAETEALDLKKPFFFFSTHPRMLERVESFAAMVGDRSGAGVDIGSEAYLAKTSSLRRGSLEEDLSMSRYKSVILALEGETSSPGYPAHAAYYLGEAYRQRGSGGDAERALQAYRKALAVAPDFALTYRALGLYFFKRKDYGTARGYLETYLELAPEGPGRDYARHYIDQIEGREEP